MIRLSSYKWFHVILVIGMSIFFLFIYLNDQKVSKPTGISLVIKKLHDNDNRNIDISHVIEHRYNIALNYYNEWKKYSNSDDWNGKGLKTCNTTLPGFQEIEYNNIFWQTIPNTNKTQFFLYNAFYDNRGTDNYVRVVAVHRVPPLRNKLW